MGTIDILGIDLGTTNSAIAIWDLNAACPRVLCNQTGEPLTPSIVLFDPNHEQAIVGKPAMAQMTSQPERVFYSIKRFIGSTFLDQWVRYDQQHVTYDIEETQQHRVAVRLGDRLFSPSQISSEILRKLKSDAEAALGGTQVTKAIITVPAYFNEAQRQATKEAGELAGLYVLRIINEPTAAALAFGLGKDPQTVAIYDLGGGTFDISILRIDHGLFRVKATRGDTHLGGDDFDQAIVKWLVETFEQQHKVTLPLEANPHLRAVLRKEAERAKIALSTERAFDFHLPQLILSDDCPLGLDITLSRTHFEELVQPLIRRTLENCDIVLKEAGLTSTEIDQVLLVGGQTRTPAIKTALTSQFGWKLNDSINPDEAVAQGAAVLGARLCGYLRDQVNLWDVNPLALGIELADGRIEQIIRANVQIPVAVSRESAFTTQRDGQEHIRFRIFQGERPLATDNILIGEVTLTLTTPRPAGEPRINCSFKVDQDGILHVRAEDVDADSKPVEVTFDHVYSLTQQEVDEKLLEAETHREEDERVSRFLQLKEELRKLRQRSSSEALKDSTLLERLSTLDALIAAKKFRKAESLLKELGKVVEQLPPS